MKNNLINLIRCPKCKNKKFSVSYFEENQIEIRRGTLACNNCKEKFSINRGILNLLFKPNKIIIKEQEGWNKMFKDTIGNSDDLMLSLPHCKNFPKEKENWKPYASNFAFILNKLSLKGKEIVLDLGAGRCWTTREFAKKGCQSVAFDILREKYIGLETAELYINSDKTYFERILGDMNDLPFKDEAFDIVFSCASFHHCSNLKQLFKESTRILKKEGKLVLISEPVRGLFESSKMDCKEIEHGINEHNYRFSDYLFAAHKAGLRPKTFLPPNVIEMLETGNIKGNKSYKLVLGKFLSLISHNDYCKKKLFKLNFFGQLFIGMGLIMIAEKNENKLCIS